MAHRPALSRNCSESRTMQLGLCSKRRGDPTPSCYCTSFIGCQSSSGSHTSWQFWRTKFGARPLRFIYTAESQNALANLRSAAIPLLDKPFMRTDFSRRMTDCLELAASNSSHQWFSTLSLFLNIDFKVFCSIRLLLNTDPTCRLRLWSQDRMAL